MEDGFGRSRRGQRPCERLGGLLLLGLLLGLLAGCSSEADSGAVSESSEEESPVEQTPENGEETGEGPEEPGTEAPEPTDDGNGEQASSWEPEGPVFDPFIWLGAEIHEPLRGQVVRRGTIHLHTGYSHDACDGEVWLKNAEPEDADGENILVVEGTSHLQVVEAFEQCNRDVRAAVCLVEQDFLFHTDHNNNFPSYEYPDVLLYDPELGDELIMRDGAPVANWLTCENGRRILLSAGVDTHLLAFGLERHVVEDMDERRRIYGSRTEEAVQQLKDAGALVVSGYSDEWDVDLLFSLPFDGFEIYNPATNLRNLGDSARFMGQILINPQDAPKPPVLMLAFFQENPENLTRWATLATMRPIFNYVGTNAHQNVFRQPLVHGERIDSFQRMMGWFSNYVLMPEDESDWNDRTVKEAIGAGRHYGVYEYLGVPIGFDFHLRDAAGEVHEMGARVPFSEDDAPSFRVVVPELYGALPPTFTPPEIRARLLRATPEGEWIVVRDETESFDHVIDAPGAYRVDVRMIPHHLREWLGPDQSRVDRLIRDVVWIYANSIFVGIHLDDDAN